MSLVTVEDTEIQIRKNYFWGIIGTRIHLHLSDVISIRTKEYEVDPHEDVWVFSEEGFNPFMFDFLKPKVKWVTTKLVYVWKGMERSIELKVTRDNFEKIERRIKHEISLDNKISKD